MREPHLVSKWARALNALHCLILWFLETTHRYLDVAFFCLMGGGLMLGTYFLQMGKITGTEYVALCGTIFTADRVGHAIKNRPVRRDD